jgi:transcriptional regulator with XRE-family HTH domain
VRPITRLRHERKVRRISQPTVAAITGVEQSVISLAETGRFIPTARQLQALSDFYGVPPGDLLKTVVVVEARRCPPPWTSTRCQRANTHQ